MGTHAVSIMSFPFDHLTRRPPGTQLRSHLTIKQLTCCSVHDGKYEPETFRKLAGIRVPCYAPNENQPDEGCDEPIETTWGPAKPCRDYLPNTIKQN